MITVHQLSKNFKIKSRKKKKSEAADPREERRVFHAIREVSFQCDEGMILGLLGPNGAGKTTLLRLLSTALKPTSGWAEIHGSHITQDPLAVRKKIGFLSGNTGLYGRLSPREMVGYYARLHGMPAGGIPKRIDELFATLDMRDFADRRCDTLSTGMKQKVSIARTLVHDPEVVIFDEPTTGLDVSAAETILGLIARCRERGKTVLFSTHHMHEVERLCDAVVMLNRGEMCFNGSVTDMKQQTQHSHLDQAFLSLISEEVNLAA